MLFFCDRLINTNINRPIRDFFGFLSLIFSLVVYFRPLRFFLIPGILFLLSGTAIGINQVTNENNLGDSSLLLILVGIQICFLGVTFKANTDDMRDSACLKMIPALSKKGAIIKYFDPTGYKKEFKKIKNVSYTNSIKKSVENSDLVIIHTEWNDFKSINFKNLAKNNKLIIYDMRNIYSPSKIIEQGFRYFSIGR